MKWEKKQITLVTLKSIFYSCTFSYLELERMKLMVYLNLLNLNKIKMNLGLHCFVYVL